MKSFQEQIKSKEAQIVKLQAAIVDLRTKAENSINYDEVQAGRTVTFNYGKAPNVRSLTGLVLGRKDKADGVKGPDLVKIAVGSGFDAQTLVVFPQAVTKIEPLPAAEGEAQAE